MDDLNTRRGRFNSRGKLCVCEAKTVHGTHIALHNFPLELNLPLRVFKSSISWHHLNTSNYSLTAALAVCHPIFVLVSCFFGAPPFKPSRTSGWAFLFPLELLPCSVGARAGAGGVVMYLCPTPMGYCTGSLKQIEPGNRNRKVHSHPYELRRCVHNYVQSVLGYKRLTSTVFVKEGCLALVVSKVPGERLRKGKEGTRWMQRPVVDSVPGVESGLGAGP